MNAYYKCKADSKEDMYLFIAYHIKHSIYKMKASMCFTLDITTSIQYNILYCNREMLHDGSIRCAQAGGSDQASCKPCFSLACTVGLHGFLKEASTCRIEISTDICIHDPTNTLRHAPLP